MMAMIANQFELFAAIDLRDGRVVRLRQGAFDQETRYGTDPVDIARGLVDQDADWLHIVDLDGARLGRPVQSATIAAISAAVDRSRRVEVAGGLRAMAAVDGAIDAGAARVVLGTAAVRDPDFAGRVVRRFGDDRVAVALDIRDGTPVVDGWVDASVGRSAVDAFESLAARGVTTFEVTAVERDGMLEGPDLDLLGRLVGLGRGRVVASGGITTLGDLRAVRDLGCAGAIVGRAIYEGVLDLRAARAGLDVSAPISGG